MEELKIVKIQDKIELNDVEAQGCRDDCEYFAVISQEYINAGVNDIAQCKKVVDARGWSFW